MDLDTTPAGLPPPGVTPDFNASGPWLLKSIITFTVFSILITFAVAIRVFTKLYIMREFHRDDYILVVAALGALLWNSLCSARSNGDHIWNIPASRLPAYMMIVNTMTSIGIPIILLGGWAVLAQMQRVFNIHRSGALGWTLFGLTLAGTLGHTILLSMTIFQCTPREKIWELDLPGKCLTNATLFLVTALNSVVLNVGILCIPPWALASCQMNRRHKLTAILMFSGNCGALVCALVRIWMSISIAQSVDYTYYTVPEALAAGGEMLWLILSVCIPTMPRFWRWLRWWRRNRSPANGTAPRPAPRLTPRRPPMPLYPVTEGPNTLNTWYTIPEPGEEPGEKRFGAYFAEAIGGMGEFATDLPEMAILKTVEITIERELSAGRSLEIV